MLSGMKRRKGDVLIYVYYIWSGIASLKVNLVKNVYLKFGVTTNF